MLILKMREKIKKRTIQTRPCIITALPHSLKQKPSQSLRHETAPAFRKNLTRDSLLGQIKVSGRSWDTFRQNIFGIAHIYE
ncbi:hypothetical protein KBY27_10525 [Ruegeria pomeroyi]|uniref:Uncharacterized protein n=1 Tax=Ruegeria pomeroyi TaxID=89184 RepID=A0A9Q3WL98_9RHOB|nr:hypothetical protein [Ruegeria pomeroyi]MCE8537895.1 hypothetical protein [Ruegeria pomeroyi]